VASIVDLRVFWQPGSVLFVLNCRDYFLFESNKFLLLLLLLPTLHAGKRSSWPSIIILGA